MIKELKVNLYRLLRSKSPYVILGILIFGSILSAFVIKFCVDDPFGLLSKFKVDIVDAATTEAEKDSYESLAISLDDLANTNCLSGVVGMNFCAELVFFLWSIVFALFVSGEFKSKFHVNHYSLNPNPAMIVFLEWLTLCIVLVVLEILCYLVSLGLSVALCSSFTFTDGLLMLQNGAFMLGVMITFASLAFMVAYLRKASPLAIVLSALWCFGVFDLIFALVQFWIPWSSNFDLKAFSTKIALNKMTTMNYVSGTATILLLAGIFLGVTLYVASKRDPY